MNSQVYRDFEDSLNSELHQAVESVIDAATRHLLTPAQVSSIKEVMAESYPAYFTGSSSKVEDPQYGADFDIGAEVNAQIRLVRALREKITDPNTGGLLEKVSLREAKEASASATTMLASLMKHHKDIVNMDRLRSIEAAVVEVVRELPVEKQELFQQTLKRNLENRGV